MDQADAVRPAVMSGGHGPLELPRLVLQCGEEAARAADTAGADVDAVLVCDALDVRVRDVPAIVVKEVEGDSRALPSRVTELAS